MNRMFPVEVSGVIDEIKSPFLFAPERLGRPSGKSIVDDDGWRRRRAARTLLFVVKNEMQLIAGSGNQCGISERKFVPMFASADSLFGKVESAHVVVVAKFIFEIVSDV